MPGWFTTHDLSFLSDPGWTTEENRVGCFAGVFQASLRADLILSISESSRRHFLETFPHYPAERVAVVYPGSRFESGGAGVRPPQADKIHPHRFWLSVATLEPRKNHERLLRAYASLKKTVPGTLPASPDRRSRMAAGRV